MCVLFPASCTMLSSQKAPRDAAVSEAVRDLCVRDLGLCPSRSETMGTEFDTSYLDEYDLVVCLSEDIRSCIFRSLKKEGVEHQDYYRPRCRLLSEFLSSDFVSNTLQQSAVEEKQLSQQSPPDPMETDQWKMLDTKYQYLTQPYLNVIAGRSSNLFEDEEWPVTQAGLIWASAGITKFCLTTIQVKMETALDAMLQRIVFRPEHLEQPFSEIDMMLRKCNASVTGFFSPGQRQSRYERPSKALQKQWRRHETNGESK